MSGPSIAALITAGVSLLVSVITAVNARMLQRSAQRDTVRAEEKEAESSGRNGHLPLQRNPGKALMRADAEMIFAAVADRRRHIADVLDNLDRSQLACPSLCAGWDVKTVAAHLVSVFADSFWVFMTTAARRASMARAIDELARRRAELPPAEIADILRRCADHPLSPPLFGPLDPLADILVHSGDICIPLKLPFEPDPELAALALDFLAGPWPFGFVPLGRLRGLSLRATDAHRTWGKGAEIYGPATALVMSVSGRDALLHELDGPGLPVLRRRSGWQ